VIAVDISPEELAMNTEASETCVADVSSELPFPPGSVDLIISRALLEHVKGVPSAVEQMAKVLKPGGVAVHLIPCRFSLFGVAARLMPFGPLLRLTHLVNPETRGQVEFPVVYDHCWPQALERAFLSAGFREAHCEITWACPGYFEAVFPLFVLHTIWEWTIRTFRVRSLAAYVVISASR
jgi:SAM-dependent methyltransferase